MKIVRDSVKRKRGVGSMFYLKFLVLTLMRFSRAETEIADVSQMDLDSQIINPNSLILPLDQQMGMGLIPETIQSVNLNPTPYDLLAEKEETENPDSQKVVDSIAGIVVGEDFTTTIEPLYRPSEDEDPADDVKITSLIYKPYIKTEDPADNVKITSLIYKPYIKTKDQVKTSVIDVSTEEGSNSCAARRGSLSPIGANSKYFSDTRNRYNYEQGKKYCQNNNLVLAELDGIPDHLSLQTFVNHYKTSQMYNVQDDKFFIGPNDIQHEGMYKRSDNGKKIKFQNYHVSQPDDKTMEEDCTTISKETKEGPVGSSDDDCSKRYNIFCMFPPSSNCFQESKENMENNEKIRKKNGIDLLINMTERAYYVSNFQETWKAAMDYCQNRSMQLFAMDHVVNKGFFRRLEKWETTFTIGRFPVVQYWTSGKFKQTHMKAEVHWKEKSNPTESEERRANNFTFSGIFHWSSKKKQDPGAPFGYRRDLCLSFGFEMKPEVTPFVRNTNCEIPNYFICYVVA